MKVIVNKKVPQKVQQKALEVLEQFKSGSVQPQKINRCKTVRSLKVGRDWRWLSMDNCNTFELMSHHVYNNKLRQF